MIKKTIFSILFFASIAAQAEVDWLKVENDLQLQVRKPEFIENVLDSYSLNGMARGVFREHLTEIYISKSVIKYLVDEMRKINLDKIDYKDSRAYGRIFGSELFQSLAMKGLAPLPASEQRVFLEFMHKWMTVASPEDCKWMMTDAATASALDSGKVEMKYYNKLSRDELSNYFRYIRRALLAEINDFPQPKILNQSQINIANSAFEAEMTSIVKKTKIRTEILTAMSYMDKAPAKDVCDAGKLIFKTVANMKGFAGDLMVNKFILSIN